jgi:hypothetical protein
MDERKTTDSTLASVSETPYEAPRVERILTRDDLEREGQYAGASPV